MSPSVYSITGREVNLSEASSETLAELLDGIESELRILKEQRTIVTRELVKRTGLGRARAGEWQVQITPYAYVSRAEAA